MGDSDAFEVEMDGFPEPIDPAHVARARDTVELLASEFAERVRRGEQPSVEEYLRRHPELADSLRELLPMVEALERWKEDRQSNLLRRQLPPAFQIRQLGDCRLVRELGRGGMGVVFEARQGTLGLPVAVKLLPWRISLVPERWERFAREAQAVARLQHPHIVPIYRFGRQGEFGYYVMQYVSGIDLNRLIERIRSRGYVFLPDELAGEGEALHRKVAPAAGRGRRAKGGEPRTWPRSFHKCSWESFALIGFQVADALQHAHDHGLLHNDVKPANLIIDRSGHVWITDFGLAGDPTEEDTEENEGKVTGTLRYMAPERFAGKADPRSDVYALGVTLFELVTLQPAFAGESRRAVMAAIGASDVLRPRRVRRDVPAGLDAIVRRATARDPADRYDSARAMAGDLWRFATGRRVGGQSWPSYWRWRATRWWTGRSDALPEGTSGQ